MSPWLRESLAGFAQLHKNLSGMVDGWKALQFSRAAQDGDRGGVDVANDGGGGGGAKQQVDKDARRGGVPFNEASPIGRSAMRLFRMSAQAYINRLRGQEAQIYAKIPSKIRQSWKNSFFKVSSVQLERGFLESDPGKSYATAPHTQKQCVTWRCCAKRLCIGPPKLF